MRCPHPVPAVSPLQNNFFPIFFNFGIMFNLQKSCKGKSESFYIPCTQCPLLLASHIALARLSRLRS